MFTLFESMPLIVVVGKSTPGPNGYEIVHRINRTEVFNTSPDQVVIMHDELELSPHNIYDTAVSTIILDATAEFAASKYAHLVFTSLEAWDDYLAHWPGRNICDTPTPMMRVAIVNTLNGHNPIALMADGEYVFDIQSPA